MLKYLVSSTRYSIDCQSEVKKLQNNLIEEADNFAILSITINQMFLLLTTIVNTYNNILFS